MGRATGFLNSNLKSKEAPTEANHSESGQIQMESRISNQQVGIKQPAGLYNMARSIWKREGKKFLTRFHTCLHKQEGRKNSKHSRGSILIRSNIILFIVVVDYI